MVSDFFKRLLTDKPALKEYTLKTKYEAVQWMLSYFQSYYCQIDGHEIGLDGFDREIFYKYYTNLYSLSARYSISQLYKLFVVQLTEGLTMHNVVKRLELALEAHDYKIAKIYNQFVVENGGKEKLIEIEMSKLPC
ncbi:hypothetical protein M3Y98_00098800 [Aphelenchoides besseyi]|nr:hypothetical protein M3Y98_00098800 [Aphelenchoides besseyi]KAI6198590.1 hypothetical protein M3Y96_00535300 [Aphelenchoides besseyi]